MTTATKSTRNAITETSEDALARIKSGFSKNDEMVILMFANCGIDPADIEPRENVLTFHAWKALGRRVAKGATSVRVPVYVTREKKNDIGDDGKPKTYTIQKTAKLFHISQTVLKDADKGTRPDAWQNPALVKPGTYDDAEPAQLEPAQPELPPNQINILDLIDDSPAAKQRVENFKQHNGIA